MSDRPCTETELQAHIAAWPRKLQNVTDSTRFPPIVSFNDNTLGTWPYHTVAYHYAAEGRHVASGWTICRELPR